jgi:hypothetical protein
MRMLRKLLAGPLMLATALSSAAFAQERHAVDPAAMADAISQHVGKQDADRTSIREALARPEVREVAAKAGIDLGRLTAALNTMSGDNLERAAEAAQQVNDRLVGGQRNVVLSTTTIIIVLLAVILIIVAVD